MKPLSKKIRFTSLIFTLILFLIIAPLVWLYSIGYRIDDLSDSFGWVRTGGIYIQSDLSNVDVYVNGEFVRSSGFIMRNILIQNLRADREHIIEVHKSGYHSWRKMLPVAETFVTESRTLMLPLDIRMTEILPYFDQRGNAILWPPKDELKENDSVDFASDDEISEDALVGPNNDDIEDEVDISVDDLIINQTYRDLEILFGLSEKEEGVLDTISRSLNSAVDSGQSLINGFEEVDDEVVVVEIPDYFVDLGVENPDELKNLVTNNNQVAWIEDGDIVIHWVGVLNEVPFYYCTLEECVTTLNINWDTEIKRFEFMPGRSDVIILMNESGIWATELDNRSTRNIQPVYLGENLDFRINTNNRIVVLDDRIFYELRF